MEWYLKVMCDNYVNLAVELEEKNIGCFFGSNNSHDRFNDIRQCFGIRF